MQDGGAQKRVLECVNAIDEWIEHGENSVAFRLASWRDQRVAQDDLKIAMEHDSNFLAFVRYAYLHVMLFYHRNVRSL
jgi:hypothetical protein